MLGFGFVKWKKSNEREFGEEEMEEERKKQEKFRILKMINIILYLFLKYK